MGEVGDIYLGFYILKYTRRYIDREKGGCKGGYKGIWNLGFTEIRGTFFGAL